MEINIPRCYYHAAYFLAFRELFYRNRYDYLHGSHIVLAFEHKHSLDENEQNRVRQSGFDFDHLLFVDMAVEGHHCGICDRFGVFEECRNHCSSILGAASTTENASNEVRPHGKRKDYEENKMIKLIS